MIIMKKNYLLGMLLVLVVAMVGGCGSDTTSDGTNGVSSEVTSEATSEITSEITTEVATEEVTSEEGATEEDTEVVENTGETREVKYKVWSDTPSNETNSGHYIFGDSNMEQYSYVTLDGTRSDNLILHTADPAFQLTISGPYDLGTTGGDHEDHITLATKDKSFLFNYYWNDPLEETQIKVDGSYKIVTNNQFVLGCPIDIDDELAMEYFNSIRLLTEDEAKEFVVEKTMQTEAPNNQ